MSDSTEMLERLRTAIEAGQLALVIQLVAQCQTMDIEEDKYNALKAYAKKVNQIRRGGVYTKILNEL
jgi:hypothetical protein